MLQPDNSKNSKKNSIEGVITQVGSVVIGDGNTIQVGVTAIFPKELTLHIPRTHPDDIVGREEELIRLHELLHTEKRVVVVNGLGGIGKTTLAQVYISRYYDQYHHIAWISQDADDVTKPLSIQRV